MTWQSGTVTAEAQGLVAQSQGANGGDGGASTSGAQNNGGNAGICGSGGAASTLLSGGATIVDSPFASSSHAGVIAQSLGGAGGAGGLPGAALGAGGGSGGSGGNGGPASATILGTTTLNGVDQPGVFSGYGVLVQSSGGADGAGAGVDVFVGSAGGGGFAGCATRRRSGWTRSFR